ncbi:sigma-70 family RNA polymerase sigma factor [Nocardioides sp.]|uniref:RNA polymerase sigma factor n=1 Tax=Nocardioides sp. TaxID=35761 RepID=UPI00286D7991|nr:sigma-70 family RNA polymerase sigma factor [Nocardioides sp.]
MTSTGLVDHLRLGDPAAWREAYEAHAGRLLVWLRALAPADVMSSAEDLAAETWLTASTKIGEFRGSDDDFAGWLFGIGRLHALNARRRETRRATLPTDFAADDQVPSEHHAPAADEVAMRVAAVRQLIAPLSPRERDVIVCLEVAGLDIRTTAAALDMSQATVRVARHRGLARLRRQPSLSRMNVVAAPPSVTGRP